MYNLKEMTSRDEVLKEEISVKIDKETAEDILAQLTVTAISLIEPSKDVNLINIAKSNSLNTILNMNSPVNLFNLVMTRLTLDEYRINHVVYPNLNRSLTQLSNSEKLTLVKKNILNSKKKLPTVEITGYNYTNLERVMGVKVPFIKLIEILEEYSGMIISIANDNNISDQEKCYRLTAIADEVSGIDIKKKADFSDMVNDCKIPDYYRDEQKNPSNITINNFDSYYTRLKTCKSYGLTIRKYGQEYSHFYKEIYNIVCGKGILDVYKKYDMKSDVGKKVTLVIVQEGKILNSFCENLIEYISVQLNETVNCLKQDIYIMNALVKQFTIKED